jgi:hypothetical protein
MVPAVLGQIVREHVCRLSLLEKLGGTRRFERTARMYSDSCFTVHDTVRERFPVVLFALAPKQCAEVLDAFVVKRIGRLEAGPAKVARRSEVNSIRGESVPDQHRAHTLGCFVVFENGENQSAHDFLPRVAAGSQFIR